VSFPPAGTQPAPPAPEARQNNFWHAHTNSDTVFVFIHGIFSDSHDCWLFKDPAGQRTVFWPDLIRADTRLGGPSIYLAGYHTALDAGDFPVDQCAREVSDALQRPEEDGRPPVLASTRLVFICHSTGGIVARYMLERYRELFRAGRRLRDCVAPARIACDVASPRPGRFATSGAVSCAGTRRSSRTSMCASPTPDEEGRFDAALLAGKPPSTCWLSRLDSAKARRLIPPRLKIVSNLSAGRTSGHRRPWRGPTISASSNPDRPITQASVPGRLRLEFREVGQARPAGIANRPIRRAARRPVAALSSAFTTMTWRSSPGPPRTRLDTIVGGDRSAAAEAADGPNSTKG
jgi:hypothetical protein